MSPTSTKPPASRAARLRAEVARRAEQVIDPRIQQRRLDVQRAESRRRATLLVSVSVVLGLGLAGWGVLRSPLLAVRHITISGAVHASPPDVLRAAGLVHHRQMADLDTTGMGRAIDALPWIDTARVVRRWPDRVVITVTERHPIAVVADAQGGWALVDRTGRVLGLVPAPPAGAVQVSLAAPPPPSAAAGTPAPAAPAPPAPAGAPGTTIPVEVQPALSVVSALAPPLSSRVVGVSLLSDGEVRLDLTNASAALLGTPDDLGDKLTALVTVLAKVPVKGETVDVRVPTAPVLTGSSP